MPPDLGLRESPARVPRQVIYCKTPRTSANFHPSHCRTLFFPDHFAAYSELSAARNRASGDWMRGMVELATPIDTVQCTNLPWADGAGCSKRRLAIARRMRS